MKRIHQLLVAAVLIPAVMWGCGKDKPTDSQPKTGMIAVSSDPFGANIYLDGVDTYKSTPDTLVNVSVGSHVIELNLTGYADWSDTVRVSRDSITVIEAVLVRTTGTLIVTSTPEGAGILLDSVNTGFVTPHTFDSIFTGTYYVTLIMSGYQDWSQEVPVETNQTSEVIAEFEPLPGQLTVLSSPSGAEIWLDGANTSFTTPHTFTELEPGSYQLKLLLDDYAKWTGEAIVVNDSLTVIEAVLTRLTGGLFVISTPPGATIWLNEQNTGLTTPHTFDSLETGAYYLKLTKYGYHDWTGEAVVEELLTTEINAVLEPTYGSLYVGSTPAGASISLDGSLTGEVTPATISGISVGSHLVELRLTGYVTWSESIWIGSDSLSTIEVALVRLTGTLVITSDPTGATIWLDDANTGFTTPHTFDSLDPGAYSIKLTLSSYHDWVDEAIVEAFQTTEISAILDPAYGSLSVNSTPTGADIWLNGVSTGFTSPHTFPELFPGSYRVKLTKPTYREWFQDVVVEADQTAIVNAELEQLPTALVIASTPSGAEVWINDGATGETTPVTMTGLAPGAYTVRLLYPRYFPWGTEVELSLGETKHISATMDPAPETKIAFTINDSIFISGLDGINPQLFATDYNSWVRSYISYLGKILWSPNGEYLVYTSTTKSVAIRHKNSSEEALLDGARSMDFNWSDNSRYLLYGSYRGGIYRYDVLTKAFERIMGTWCYCYDHNPVYRPGNSAIAFIHQEYGRNAYLYLMEADGSNRYRASNAFRTGFDEEINLAWISNTKLVFKTGSGIYQLDLSGYTDTTLITPNQLIADNISQVRLSSDKRWYAYLSSVSGLNYGQVGNWSSSWLAKYPTLYHFTWAPANDAIACRTDDGVHWVLLDGTDYHIISNSSAGKGSVAVVP